MVDSTDISGSFLFVFPILKILSNMVLPLPQRTADEANFKFIADFFRERDILWSWCVTTCSDGAAAMTRTTDGFIVLQNNSIVFSRAAIEESE